MDSLGLIDQHKLDLFQEHVFTYDNIGNMVQSLYMDY
mgnify:CR=1 FL=1